MFPVPERFGRSVWCGRAQNKAQDRGWALPNMSYSNTPSASSVSHSSARSAPLFSPHHSYHAHACSSLFPVSPRLSSLNRRPPPSSASSPPAVLPPPPASSCVGSRPCSQSPSPSCPGNGVRRDALARRCTAEFLPEVLATEALEMWLHQQKTCQVARSNLAELVQLLKQLVVNIE